MKWSGRCTFSVLGNCCKRWEQEKKLFLRLPVVSAGRLSLISDYSRNLSRNYPGETLHFPGHYPPHIALHLFLEFIRYLLVLSHTSCMPDFLLLILNLVSCWLVSADSRLHMCKHAVEVHLQLNYFIYYASSCFAHVCLHAQFCFLVFSAIKPTSCLLDCHPYLSQLLFGFTCQIPSCNIMWHFCLCFATDC